MRERIIVKLASIELSPRELVARVPFVVLVIGSLGVGLGVTLWLSTDAAERSYQLSHARETNQALLQQKEALERQVLEAQAAPALAEAARNLGMIPSRDTAHLVQDASGNWVVVGTPKPAQGIAPPPLNSLLPEEGPPIPPPPPAPRVVEPREVTVRVPPRVPVAPAPLPGIERSLPVTGAVPLAAPPGVEVPHAVTGQMPALGPAVAPAPPAEVPAAPAVPAEAPVVPLDAGPPPAAPPVSAPVPAAPA
jgi:cell division protein FtsB